MRPTPTLFLLSLVLVAAQLGWYLPRLPDPMASSFGFNGEVSAWASRTSFLVAYLLSLGVTSAVFMVLPILIQRTDGRGLNIPNQDHWLAPEHRAETFQVISVRLRWFGLVTMVFLVWTHHLVIVANLSSPIRMASAQFWVGFAAYMLYASWWTLRLILRFQKRPDA